MTIIQKIVAQTELFLRHHQFPIFANANTRGYDIIGLNQLKKPPHFLITQHVQRAPRQIQLTPFNSEERLAVIIPFRHREHHLQQLLPKLRDNLEQANRNFSIFVMHQTDQQLFNKGAICNAGFLLLQDQFDTFCFHDVDLLPIDADYRYPGHPTCLHHWHTCAYFGGVVLFNRQDYQAINGFSNRFWNWGWEDENMRDRCYLSGLVPLSLSMSKFEELKHKPSATQTPDGQYHDDEMVLADLKQAKRKNRDLYLSYIRGHRDFRQDGLNDLQFDIIQRVNYDTHEMIDINLV